MSRRVALAVALALLLLAGLALAGRWEAQRAAARQNAEMRDVYEAAGGAIDAESLSGYREAELDCLFYEAGPDPYALQLCFDEEGRLVETVDRRGGAVQYVSLVPADAETRVDPAELDRLFRRLEKLSR